MIINHIISFIKVRLAPSKYVLLQWKPFKMKKNSFVSYRKHFSSLRIHWKLSTILKASMKEFFFNMCIFFISVFNALWDKGKILFFHYLQLIIVLLLIHDSYTSWSTRFVSPFSIPSRFYQSLYFCSTKRTDSLTLKRHYSFQN